MFVYALTRLKTRTTTRELSYPQRDATAPQFEVKERPGLSMNQDSRHSHMWLSWTPGAWNSLTLYPRSHSIRCIASLYPRSASPGDLDPRLPRPTDRACGSKSETATPATTGTRNRRALWSSAAFAVYCSSAPLARDPRRFLSESSSPSPRPKEARWWQQSEVVVAMGHSPCIIMYIYILYI